MAYIGVSPSNGVRQKHTYTATANQTSFSGAGAEGISLSYLDSNYVDVYQNGVKLSEADYTSTTGTTVVLATGATVSDMIEIIVYDVFSVADTVSKADGGTFDGNVTMAGTLAVTGETTLATHLNMGDGDIIKLGASADLTIQHDGSRSIIQDSGTGNLRIQANNLELNNADNSENYLFASADGQVELYHNNVKKFETTSSGVTVTGGVTTTTASSIEGGVVFNESSADVDFRVESNGNANMLFVDGGNDIVAIGKSSNDTVGGFKNALQVEGTGAVSSSISVTRNTNDSNPAYLQFGKSRGTSVGSNTIVQDDDEIAQITFNAADGTNRDTPAASIRCSVDATPGENDMPGRLMFFTTADGASSSTERVRINSSGNLTVGSTSADSANVGARLKASGRVDATTDGGVASIITRLSNNGDLVSFKQGTSAVGTIQTVGGAGIAVGTGDTALRYDEGSNVIAPFDMTTGNNRDNVLDLGSGSARFDDIFATNGTIQTSDRNEKQDIEELTDAEKRVAVVAKGLMRKYRWKDKVAEKGDKARTHFGIIAQDLQDAFTAEDLDAGDYAMFTSTTWWEKEISVDAVEAKDTVYEEVTDSDGMKTNNIVSHEVEAQDAYTYIDIKQEATTGYTEKTRLGVRYPELLAFIISAI